jgi:hypothetical protein
MIFLFVAYMQFSKMLYLYFTSIDEWKKNETLMPPVWIHIAFSNHAMLMQRFVFHFRDENGHQIIL